MSVGPAHQRARGIERSVTAPNPLESSATATIDLSSVTTGNDMRDNDLRSSNFFDAATHPEMTFRSAGVRRDGDDLIVDGDLTIRGVTKPVSLTFEVNGFGPDPYGGTRAGFSPAARSTATISASASTRRFPAA
ncbi:MAG TPA: YceI family protein [Streptosporangiaceae bacterium]|nr:YceI family protein [Streptosporangiaceae bacterium]